MGIEVFLDKSAIRDRLELKPVVTDHFEALVQALKDALGPSSGLTSDDVDVEHLKRLMQEYTSNEMEWSKYAFGDRSRGYTRNLVDEGNGKSNLVGSNQASRKTSSQLLLDSEVPDERHPCCVSGWSADPEHSLC